MFFKKKYVYDEKNCNFIVYRFSFKNFILLFLLFLLFSVLLAFFISEKFIKKNYQKMLNQEIINENIFLKNELVFLKNDIEKIFQDLNSLKDQDESIYRIIMNCDPIKDVEKKENKESIKKYDDESLLLIQKKIDIINQKIEFQKKSYQNLISSISKRENYFDCIPAIQPISNKNLKRIGDVFGMRVCHPIFKVKKMHSGIDYVAPRGTPVYATGNGIVKSVKYSLGYGKCIEIQHNQELITRYAHLNEYNTKIGDKVIRGQCIGYVGSTGRATGPHLHYEILKNSKAIDPIFYFFGELSPAQYERILEMANKKVKSSLV